MGLSVTGNRDNRRVRAQLNAVIDGFELDIRSAVAAFLLEPHAGDPLRSVRVTNESESRLRIARSRQEHFRGFGSSSISRYLDIRPCLDLTSENLHRFPTDLAGTLGSISRFVPEFMAIRYRTIHGRPLLAGDADALLCTLGSLDLSWFPDTRRALIHIAMVPLWEPPFNSKPVPLWEKNNNLPDADHHESVLAGREADLLVLADMLGSKSSRVMTLEDDGHGVAAPLALEVAYGILDGSRRFDAVFWVTDKARFDEGAPCPLLHAAACWHTGFERVARVIGAGFDAPSADDLPEMLARIGSTPCLVIVVDVKSQEASGMEQIFRMLPDTVNYLFLTNDSASLKHHFPAMALHRVGASGRPTGHVAD